jgi:hypothetical protein
MWTNVDVFEKNEKYVNVGQGKLFFLGEIR